MTTETLQYSIFASEKRINGRDTTGNTIWSTKLPNRRVEKPSMHRDTPRQPNPAQPNTPFPHSPTLQTTTVYITPLFVPTSILLSTPLFPTWLSKNNELGEIMSFFFSKRCKTRHMGVGSGLFLKHAKKRVR